MPKTPDLEITQTSIESTLGSEKTPISGWVEFSDGKVYHWTRLVGGEPLLSTRSRVYEGAPWDHRFFKSPKRVALLVEELDG